MFVKTKMKHLPGFLAIVALGIGLLTSPPSRAQDEPRAAWAITNYDISVPSLGTERALNARATISERNIARDPGPTLTIRINSTAEIKSVSIGSTSATFTSRPDVRGNSQRTAVQRVTINLPSAVAPNQDVSPTIEYRIPVAENSGAAAVSPVGSQFLPQAAWYPQVNNEFSLRGADYAPFRLTVNGASALSSGVDKSSGANSMFEQSLKAQPFFITGAWDRVDGANAKGISAYLAKGAGADERKQAESLISLANDARSF